MKWQKCIMVFLCSLLFVGFACSRGFAEVAEMKLRFANFLPATLIQMRVDQWFADELKKRSNGKITMDIYWAGALGKPNELLNLVRTGAVDVASTSPGYFPAEIPFMAALNSIPLSLRSPEEAQRIMHTLTDEMDELQKEAKRHNVRVLFWHVNDVYYILSRKPIRRVEDFRGLKIRSWGEYAPELFKRLGAVPVNILPAELYESLQRGVIDAAPYSYSATLSLKLHEVAKYYTTFHVGVPGGWPQYYNLKNWESWPRKTQQLFEEIAEDAKKTELKWIEEENRVAIRTMKEAGVEFIDISKDELRKFESLSPDFFSVWIEKMKGIGQESGARAMVQRWIELQQGQK